mmetsp:Transcript_279/g.721  ORF Transcript_279/g.721 Transcript_279/m.721 type:complete len:97 (+) Transcript_279:2-292(+)
MGAIRIAVLAPCVKLQIADSDTIQAGSPAQIDFRSMGQLLEETVLSRWSQIKTVSDDIELSEGGAGAIFPELKDTMTLIQKEVTNRLLTMMRDALA